MFVFATNDGVWCASRTYTDKEFETKKASRSLIIHLSTSVQDLLLRDTMKFLFTALTALPLLTTVIKGSPMLQQANKKKPAGQPIEPPAEQSSEPSGDGCTLTGTYKKGTSISSCDTITVDSLTVPAGVTLDLSAAKKGATIQFLGTTTFGTQLWAGPLVSVGGTDLTVKGPGILEGQGTWYWEKGPSILRPIFFKLQSAINSIVSDFTIMNMPYRTFSVVNCVHTTITGITIDSSAGNGLAKNTDGFGLTKNDYLTITKCKIYNQDDCLAMQSSTNTVFSNNYCRDSHGISIGSVGGNAVDQSTTVMGLTVQGNTIENSENGLRIKTIIGLKGLISNVKYINNKVVNVDNAISIHSDYSKERGRYLGSPTSLVTIKDITISGLSGTARNLYDIVANPDAVSGCAFSGLSVVTSSEGIISGITP